MGGCCQLALLCENEGHRGLHRALWVLRDCLGTTSVLRSVRVWGKKEGEAAENQILLGLCSSEALSNS